MGAERGTGRVRSQSGETLLESLLAITILAIVATAAFAGLRVALKASVMHHEIAVAETLLRSAAEDLQNPASTYIPLAGCPGHANYDGLPTRARFSPIDVSVGFWDPSSSSPVAMAHAAPPAPPATAHSTEFLEPGICPMEDPGLQQLRLRLVTPSGHVQTLDVLKRDG